MEIDLPPKLFLKVNERLDHSEAAALLAWFHRVKLFKERQLVLSEVFVHVGAKLKATGQKRR